MRVEEQMANLIAKLNEATAHYEAGKPIMSDEKWDNMYFELKQFEEESGIQLPSSPTFQILPAVSNLTKVKHTHPMLSCDKTKNLSDILDFCKKSAVIATHKLDGLSCSLTYQYGKLVRAETRGDGEVGEDVTHNVQFISNLPLTIGNTSEEFVVDGEIIVRVNDFEKFEDNYSNPRALAVGGLRLLSSNESKKIPLRFIAWKLISEDYFTSFIDELKYLDNLGFETVERYNLFLSNFTGFEKLSEEILNEIIKQLVDLATAFQYPIDGIIFRYDDVVYGESLGATAHHRRDMLAYKFYDEEYETKLLDIDWTMGKTGVLTPVAIFEPVEIDGTIVERANLHNLNIINNFTSSGYFVKGHPIWVAKMNHIIPQITRADEEFTVVNSSGQLYCPNPECSGKAINKFDYYCSKKGLDIKGLSKATIEKLIDWGWLNEFADIYCLKDHRDEWIKKDGWGIASVDKILNAIEESKETELCKFIAALGIPFIGPSTAKLLCKYIKTYEDFRNLTAQDLIKIEGISMSRVDAIESYDYSWADAAVKYLHLTSALGNEIIGSPIKDKTFVITGRLNHFRNRDELVNKIVSFGGKVVNSVSARTDYLINNDIESKSAKNQSAKALNIPIISEEDFLLLTNNK